MQPTRARLLVALLPLAIGACIYPATQATVVLDTDAPADRTLTVRVSVQSANTTDGGGEVRTFVRGPGATGSIVFPASFGITPGHAATNAAVSLVIDASLDGGPGAPPLAFRRLARFSFIPRTNGSLPIFLSTACGASALGCTSVSDAECTTSILCADRNATCGDDGVCVPIEQTLVPIPSGVTTPPLDVFHHAADTGMDASTFTDATDTPVDRVTTDSTDAPAVDAGTWGPFGTPTQLTVLNSTTNDWGPSVTGTGDTLYFASDRMGGGYRIFVSTRPVGGLWIAPVLVTIDGFTQTNDPDISRDGTTLRFTSGMPVEATYEATQVGGAIDHFAPRDTVQTPGGCLVGPCATTQSTGPAASADQLTLYFSHDTSTTTTELLIATRASVLDAFGPGTPLGIRLAGSMNDGWPSISSDELTLYWEANPGIVTATRPSRAAAFGAPVLVAEVNLVSEGDPFISADDSTLYFASYRGGTGGADLYSATRTRH